MVIPENSLSECVSLREYWAKNITIRQHNLDSLSLSGTQYFFRPSFTDPLPHLLNTHAHMQLHFTQLFLHRRQIEMWPLLTQQGIDNNAYVQSRCCTMKAKTSSISMHKTNQCRSHARLQVADVCTLSLTVCHILWPSCTHLASACLLFLLERNLQISVTMDKKRKACSICCHNFVSLLVFADFFINKNTINCVVSNQVCSSHLAHTQLQFHAGLP